MVFGRERLWFDGDWAKSLRITEQASQICCYLLWVAESWAKQSKLLLCFTFFLVFWCENSMNLWKSKFFFCLNANADANANTSSHCLRLVVGSCCSSMRFQNDHGPASISVMEADWLSDATELLRPVAENRFLLVPARWMSRMSEPKPDRCYWRISFTFFTLNWNSLSHGNEKSLHGSSWKALKTSWIKNKKNKNRWITLRRFFSRGAAFPPHTITTLLFTCTAHKQSILNCR